MARRIIPWGIFIAIPLLLVGLARGADISGYAYQDIDGNGLWAPGEPGLMSVQIVLSGTDDLGAPVSLTTTTVSTGEYWFTNLRAGTYYVAEVPPTFWTETSPTTVFHTMSGVLVGDNITGKNFGNFMCQGPTAQSVCLSGIKDNFVTPETSYVDAELWTFVQTVSAGGLAYYDSAVTDRGFGHTFLRCWPATDVVVAATLCLHVKALSGSNNDGIAMGDWSQDGRIWSTTLNALYTIANPSGDHSWDAGDEMTICIDLQNLPPNAWLPTNILGALQDGSFDLFLQDDTEVDWAELTVTTCSPKQCFATGDANNDGIPLTLGDATYISNFITSCGPRPTIPNSFDLNGDAIVDTMDIKIFLNYQSIGMAAFAPYGGYPVPCPCDPILIAVPDTVTALGRECISEGTTCLAPTGGKLTIHRFPPRPPWPWPWPWPIPDPFPLPDSIPPFLLRDGVTITLPPFTDPNNAVVMAHLDTSFSLPDSGFLEWGASGKVISLASSGPILTGIMTDSGIPPRCHFSAGFPGVDHVTVNAYRGETLVLTKSGHNTPGSDWWQRIASFPKQVILPASSSSLQLAPETTKVKLDLSIGRLGAFFYIDIEVVVISSSSMIAYPVPVKLPWLADSVLVDRIVVMPENSPFAYGPLETFDIRGCGLTSLTIDSLTVRSSCCTGTTGNVNMSGIVDLGDLSALVNYLTGGGYVLSCKEEANVNNSGIVDLADLSALVSYLTGGGFVLPNCP